MSIILKGWSVEVIWHGIMDTILIHSMCCCGYCRYQLLQACWDEDPERRPSFSDLIEIFEKAMQLTQVCHAPTCAYVFVCTPVVALNFQTDCTELDINRGRFLQNGNSGYVLKPEVLRDGKTAMHLLLSKIYVMSLDIEFYFNYVHVHNELRALCSVIQCLRCIPVFPPQSMVCLTPSVMMTSQE